MRWSIANDAHSAELTIIISYPTSVSGIHDCSTKEREFFPTLFAKTTDFQLALILRRHVQLPHLESIVEWLM